MKKTVYLFMGLLLALSFAGPVPAQEPVKKPAGDEPLVKPKGEDGSPVLPEGMGIEEGGEEFGSATWIFSLPYSDSGYTCDNWNDYTADCTYDLAAPDVVYAYMPATDTVLDIDLCGSSYDTALHIYEDTYTPGSSYACDDDYCGYAAGSGLEGVPVYAGHVYYIVVDGYYFYCGSYVLNVTEGAPPPDEFVADKVIPSLPYTDSDNSCFYGNDYDVCYMGNSADVVYSYTPPTDQVIDASLCGSSYDTRLGVYENDQLGEIGCNDDYCGLQSELQGLALTAGNTYYIVVAGWSSNCGSYVLNVTSDAPPDNDSDGWSPPEDCNDNDPNVNPGATEIVDDGVDNDCDGSELCYVDADDDIYRPDAFSTIASADLDCTDPGEAQAGDPTGDCNDGDPAINPGATDIPDNGIDEDCNGVDATLCYVDADTDGYGTSLGTTVVAPDGSCDTAQGESTTADDCNDGDPAINPGATEVCDGVDNNCDGQIDEGCVSVDRITAKFSSTRRGIRLKAFVFVTDNDGPLPGVEVEAHLVTPDAGAGVIKTATTDTAGRATFKILSRKLRGTWQVCVTGINTPGYTFAPGPNDCRTWVH